MSKFWVDVEESYKTSYLVEASSRQEVKDIFDELPIEEIKQLAESVQVEHSHWEVADIRNEDGSPTKDEGDDGC